LRPSRRPIIIATRRSTLARAQARAVAAALHRLHPVARVDLLELESEGDRRADASLAEVGGKGLFTTAIEQAVLAGRADLAVHSLKDLPVAPTEGLVLAAVPKRGDVRDCLIAHTASSLDQLPPHAVVGTSSPRRAAQLKRWRSDLTLQPMRGNIDTRIRKVKQEQLCDATLLAVAGLHRAGLAEHAASPIDVETILPAASQAALALQCRADDHVTIRRCLPLNDALTAACVEAERAIVAGLEADCHSPIAALAQPTEEGRLRLRARVLSLDGRTCLEADHTHASKAAPRLAEKVLQDLLAQGAQAVLRTSAER